MGSLFTVDMAGRRDIFGTVPDPLAVVSPGGTLISGHPQETPNPQVPDSNMASGEDSDVVVVERGSGGAGSSSEHEVSDPEDLISSKGASSSVPKGRGKGQGHKPAKKNEYRPGDGTITAFPKVSGIVPRLNLCTKPEWLKVIFPRELIRKASQPFFTSDVFHLVPPTRNCRAHDSDKGMCIYYRMPSCGFRLPLTPFQIKLLEYLQAPPAQLSPAAWCYITSFERLFIEFEELQDYEPSLPLLFHYFSLAVTSDFYSLKKKTAKKLEIFISESGKGQPLSKVDYWNEGWVYIPNSKEVPSLRTISPAWRSLLTAGIPPFSEMKTCADTEAIEKIEELVSR